MNYEGQRRGESPTYPTVLLNNLALINASKAALGIAPENLGILKTKDNDYGIARLDHQFRANTQFSLRFNIEDGRDLNQLVGATLDGGGIGAPSSGHHVFLKARDWSRRHTLGQMMRAAMPPPVSVACHSACGDSSTSLLL